MPCQAYIHADIPLYMYIPYRARTFNKFLTQSWKSGKPVEVLQTLVLL